MRCKPDDCTTLFQRVILSCQMLYDEWEELITDEMTYGKFTELWFYTPDSRQVHAMARRIADMIWCWLIVVFTTKSWVQWYKLTPLGRRIDASTCHLWVCLITRNENHYVAMPKRQVKEKKPRSIRAESEAKKECKEINEDFAARHKRHHIDPRQLW